MKVHSIISNGSWCLLYAIMVNYWGSSSNLPLTATVMRLLKFYSYVIGDKKDSKRLRTLLKTAQWGNGRSELESRSSDSESALSILSDVLEGSILSIGYEENYP